jgi:hypothetical protein
MVKLRPLTHTDIIELDKLWQEHWSDSSLPGLNNRVIDSVAVDESGRIVGYGQVRLFAEAMLFLDPTVSKRNKVKALKLLMSEAMRGIKESGLEEVYAFIKDPDFSLLIQRRYGFKSVTEPGELLLKRLE